MSAEDVAYYKRREAAIIAAVGPVCDGGQYVNDIVSAVERMKRERDGAHALLDKHGALTHMIGTGSIENQRATLAERIHDLHCMAQKDAADLRAEIARLNADLARLGALKSEEVVGVLERFHAAFGVNVPPVPQDLEVCNGDKCETCVNYEIERREAINRERWAQTFPSVPWIADEQDRMNYLLNEHDRASGKMET